MSDTKEFRNFLENEFPANADDKECEGINRRDVLKLMAASAAMAGLSACTKLPTEKIVPYVQPPEEIIPGKPLFYATSMPLHGVATGLLVESHMGRPTKIEGNPDHPGSLGGTDVFAQASVLDLYDPGPLAGGHFRRAHQQLGAFVCGDGRCALEFRAERHGRAHFDRDGHFADARRADSRVPATVSRGEVASVRACGGDRCAKERAWRSASR